MSADIQVDSKLLSNFLNGLLHRQLEASSSDWFTEKLSQLKSEPKTKDLYLTFSAIPRFIGKQALQLSASDLEQANDLRQGFKPDGWSVAQAARVLTICTFPFENSESYLKILDQLFNAAEVTELVALYSALPLLPYPEKLKNRASEGIRTNMSVVFDAVVLNNPYPADYLEEGPWNQMVLKALFMERPLYQVQGLESRCNPRLTKMISNYAHERWAAGRSTSPEMWRPVGDQAEAEDKFFRQQLELAKELKLPVQVHTPHRDKKRGTTRSMDVILEHGIDPGMVIIDHNNEETVREVLDRGFWSAFTIYPFTKMGNKRMVAVVEQYGSERIIVDSSADWGISDPLAVPKTAGLMARSGIPEEDIRLTCYQNALTAYGQSGQISESDWTDADAVDQTQLFEGNSVLRGQRPNTASDIIK